MFLLPSAWTYEAGLPVEAGILGFWVGSVLVISGTGTDTVCSLLPRYGSEEPVSVIECYANTFDSTHMLEGPEYGLRSSTGPTSQDFEDLSHGIAG